MFNTSRMVQSEPGFIIGPISNLLGFILDFIFNFASNIYMPLALGLSIIIFTIFIRFLILPLNIKMHKNMEKIRALKPKMDVITEKYKNSKDPEANKKKNLEIQKMYQENGANPLSGCLPAILQMPIFITLFAMFQMPYIYISQLGQIYSRIANHVMAIPNYYVYIRDTYEISLAKLPGNINLNLALESDLLRLFNVYTPNDWDMLLNVLPSQYLDTAYFASLLAQKDMIEHFLTISLVTPAGLTFPGVILPILSAGTTFLTSKLMMRQQQPMGGDTKAIEIQQKVFLYVMPVMMGGITITAPAGVGLYWVVSNLFHLCQHSILNKLTKPKS